MPSPNVSIGFVQTNKPGTFFISSVGVVQGDAQDDPMYRFSLLQGWVANSVTQPMWGGLAISTTLANGTGGASPPTPEMGFSLVPATAVPGSAAGSLTGFTVFNQANAMLVTGNSSAPMAPSGGSINFYPIGSKARIPVAISAAAAAAWAGGITTPATIFWDTVNLLATNAAGAGIIGPIPNITLYRVFAAGCRTVSYSSGTNTANWNENAPAAVLVI